MSRKKPELWTSLTGYQRSIVRDTGCDPADAAEVEELMRSVIFHSTLDWQTARQFRKGAREAYELLQAMRAEEAGKPSYDIEMGQGGAAYNDVMFGDSGD